VHRRHIVHFTTKEGENKKEIVIEIEGVLVCPTPQKQVTRCYSTELSIPLELSAKMAGNGV
jgi:hypothetical protein